MCFIGHRKRVAIKLEIEGDCIAATRMSIAKATVELRWPMKTIKSVEEKCFSRMATMSLLAIRENARQTLHGLVVPPAHVC